MLISRKLYKIGTYFQWKTNRKSYVAYRMAPVLVTLNDLEGHSPRSFPVCRPFQVQSVEHLCSILPDFNWQHARAVSQRQLGFLLHKHSTKLPALENVKIPLLQIFSRFYTIWFYSGRLSGGNGHFGPKTVRTQDTGTILVCPNTSAQCRSFFWTLQT